MGEGEEKLGPYEAEQMQQHALAGSLTSEHLVWTERLDSWVPASAVEGLFPVVQSNLASQVVNAPSASSSTLLDPAYHTTARALRLIHFGSLLGFLTGLAHIFTVVISPKLSPDAQHFTSYVSLSLVVAYMVFFLIALIGYCMGFGAPRDASARVCLGGALACQLIPLIIALLGASALLGLLNREIGLFADFFSLGAFLGLLTFFFALIIMQPIADLLILLVMAVYLKRVSLSLGLPAADAVSFMARIRWMLGTLGATIVLLLLGGVAGAISEVLGGIAALIILLLSLAFCIQYLLTFFNYLALLSSTRQSILFQQRRAHPV